MAYYDRMAQQWHSVTGSRGGALKEWVLNDLVLSKLPPLAGLAILEVGAGNGYFLPLVLRHFSGQVPSRLVITDLSPVLLGLAQRSFKVPAAEYLVLDVRGRFPFGDGTFDLILASMVLNELTPAGLRRALREGQRVLAGGGRLLATVPHPAFVESLARRKLLRRGPEGVLTMPGTAGLRLPVARRTSAEYHAVLAECGFQCRSEDVFATPEVLRAKPGLRAAGQVPLAMLLEGEKLPLEGGG